MLRLFQASVRVLSRGSGLTIKALQKQHTFSETFFGKSHTLVKVAAWDCATSVILSICARK